MRSLALACAALAALVVVPSTALAAKPLPPKLRLVLDLRVSAVTTTVVTLRWTDRSVRERRYEISVGGRIVRLAPNAEDLPRPASPGRAPPLPRARLHPRALRRPGRRVAVGRVADPPPAPGSGPTLGGCADVPGRQPVEHARRRAAAAPQLRRLRRRDLGRGRPLPAPGLRLQPGLRHPLRDRAGDAAARAHPASWTTATRAIPARTRSRSTRASRAAPTPTATATCWRCSRAACKLYELFNARRAGAGLGRELRRRVRPALQRAAAGHVDVGRRRRPADPAGPRAPRRGAGRRDPPRPAGHRAAHPARVHPPGDALRRHDRPEQPADGPAPAAARRLRRRAVPRRRARHPGGDEALRADRGRPGQRLVLHRRDGHRPGTTTTSSSSSACRAARSRPSRPGRSSARDATRAGPRRRRRGRPAGRGRRLSS